MTKLNQWASEAATGRYPIDTLELPTWKAAAEQLSQIGYFGKLEQPSDLHQRRIIISPQIAIYTQTLKPDRPHALDISAKSPGLTNASLNARSNPARSDRPASASGSAPTGQQRVGVAKHLFGAL
jgi:hypothetical protein